MLELVDTVGAVVRPVTGLAAFDADGDEARAPVLAGDADLAGLLVEIGQLIGADAIGLVHITTSGRVGETLARAAIDPQRDGAAREDLQAAIDGIDADAGIPCEHGGLAMLLLRPRPSDRVGLYAVASGRSKVAARLAGFAPLIERSLALWMKAHIERLLRDDQRVALDRLATALLLVDGDGAIHFANHAARTLLAAATDLFEADGRLMLRDVQEATRLQLMLHHVVAQPNLDSAGDPLIVAVPRPGRFPLLLALHPLGSGPGRPRIAVQLIDAEADRDLPIAAVGDHFDLTPVECRLVDQLVRGRTLVEAAEVMRLKEQTVRTYLKQVFQKTGLRRQTDLVSAMIKTALPLLSA